MTTKYINIAPTWEQILPALLLLLSNGNATGRAEAVRELQRMARAADEAVKAREAAEA